MEPDAEGLSAARAVAQWHIGDHYWADKIITAYLNPERARTALLFEKEG